MLRDIEHDESMGIAETAHAWVGLEVHDDGRVALCSCGWRSTPEGHGWEAGQAWRRHSDDARHCV